jgi:hypothetical protein
VFIAVSRHIGTHHLVTKLRMAATTSNGKGSAIERRMRTRNELMLLRIVALWMGVISVTDLGGEGGIKMGGVRCMKTDGLNGPKHGNGDLCRIPKG